MEQKLPSRHTQSVQRTDDAALFFNIMYHKYGDHVSEHDHQDNTGYHTGIFIDDHIPAGGIDSGIIPCHQKLCQIVDIESKILIDHIIGFILQFLHTVPQFPAAIRNLIHGIRKSSRSAKVSFASFKESRSLASTLLPSAISWSSSSL